MRKLLAIALILLAASSFAKDEGVSPTVIFKDVFDDSEYMDTQLFTTGVLMRTTLPQFIFDPAVVATSTTVEHGDLVGLSDDDHTQYHNDSRAGTWLGTKSIGDLGTTDHDLLSGLADDDHTQYGALAQNETVTGRWTFNNLDVTDELTVDTSIYPSSDGVGEIGSDALTFDDVFAGTATLATAVIGELTVTGTNIWFDGTTRRGVTDSANSVFFGIDNDSEIEVRNAVIYTRLGGYKTEMTTTAFSPYTDSGMALGTSSKAWSELYVDTATLATAVIGELTVTGTNIWFDGTTRRGVTDSANSVFFGIDNDSEIEVRNAVIYTRLGGYKTEMTTTAFSPYTDSGMALGTSSKAWSELYVDTATLKENVTLGDASDDIVIIQGGELRLQVDGGGDNGTYIFHVSGLSVSGSKTEIFAVDMTTAAGETKTVIGEVFMAASTDDGASPDGAGYHSSFAVSSVAGVLGTPTEDIHTNYDPQSNFAQGVEFNGNDFRFYVTPAEAANTVTVWGQFTLSQD